MFKEQFKVLIQEHGEKQLNLPEMATYTRIASALIEQMALLGLVVSEPTNDKSFLFAVEEVRYVWVTREVLYKSSLPLDLVKISEERLKEMKFQVEIEIENGEYWNNIHWINVVQALHAEFEDEKTIGN